MLVTCTLKEVHNSLSRLIKQEIGRLDKRVTAIEHLVAKNTTTKKQEVPKPPVRKEVRLTYNLLKESEDSDFRGYDVSPSVAFTHERNKAITKKLIDVVKAGNKEFSSKDIRNAAYTYYKSLGKEHRAKSSGKYDETVVTKKRRERFNRKVTQRCTEFLKLSYAEEDRKKREKVLIPEMISSDESDHDEQGKSVFSVKELRWRSDRVNNFFVKLDDSVDKRKLDQAIRQSKARKRGKKVSTRSPPISAPKWSLK
ncbi:uncharacterized protein [Dysidea avara]|uniref:uncharacterized protein n=1 Tax=Dysidea avara TaxID=196820 RepID=UPI00331B188C